MLQHHITKALHKQQLMVEIQTQLNYNWHSSPQGSQQEVSKNSAAKYVNTDTCTQSVKCTTQVNKSDICTTYYFQEVTFIYNGGTSICDVHIIVYK